MKFGQYAITEGVEHRFSKEQDWYWKIKPVTAGMELEMSKFLTHNRWVDQVGGRKSQPPTSLEVAFREIAVTFNGTNIPAGDKPVEDGGDPFIKNGASIEEIETALSIMPKEMVMEIWRAVGRSYPNWGPSDPNEI